RVLPSVADPQRGAGRRTAVARRCGDLPPEPVDPCPRPDGDCRPPENVMAIIAIARCAKLPDYEESIRRAGGEPWVVESGINPPARVQKRGGGILLAGGRG